MSKRLSLRAEMARDHRAFLRRMERQGKLLREVHRPIFKPGYGPDHPRRESKDVVRADEAK
jgi:hypothetical protein